MNTQLRGFTDLPPQIFDCILQYLPSLRDVQNLKDTCSTLREYIKDNKVREKRTLLFHKGRAYEWKLLYRNREIVYPHLTWDFFKHFEEHLDEIFDETIFDLLIEEEKFIKFRKNIKTVILFCSTPTELELKDIFWFFKRNEILHVEEILIRTKFSLKLLHQTQIKKRIKYSQNEKPYPDIPYFQCRLTIEELTNLLTDPPLPKTGGKLLAKDIDIHYGREKPTETTASSSQQTQNKDWLTQLPHVVLDSVLQHLTFPDLVNLKQSCTTLYNYIVTQKVIEKQTLVLYTSSKTGIWSAMYCDETLTDNTFSWDLFQELETPQNQKIPWLPLNIRSLFELLRKQNFYHRQLYRTILEGNKLTPKARKNIKYLLIFSETKLTLYIEDIDNFLTKNHLYKVKELLILNRNTVKFQSYRQTQLAQLASCKPHILKTIPWKYNTITNVTLNELRNRETQLYRYTSTGYIRPESDTDDSDN